MNADGSNERVVTSGSFDWMPAWQPGGKKIAFSSGRTGLFNIWTVTRMGRPEAGDAIQRL